MPSSGIQDSLRDRGVRLTRQRRILLDLIDRPRLHLDAESLYRLAQEKEPKLNRVVAERDRMHNSGHQHFYQTRLKEEHCGKIKEYFGEPLPEIRHVEEHLGFEVAVTRTEIAGYCPHCRALRAQESTH